MARNRGQQTATALSPHANGRLQHRAITLAQLNLVLDWGRQWRQPGGRTAFFLGRRDIRLARERGIDLSGALHVAAVVADDGVVITAIKSGDARRLRRPGFRKQRNSRKWGAQ